MSSAVNMFMKHCAYVIMNDATREMSQVNAMWIRSVMISARRSSFEYPLAFS